MYFKKLKMFKYYNYYVYLTFIFIIFVLLGGFVSKQRARRVSFIFSLAAFFVTIFIAGNPENLMSFYYESSTVKADIYTDVYINISVDYMFVIYLFYVTIFFLVIILIF